MVANEPTTDVEAHVDSYFDRYEPPLAELGRAVRAKLRVRLPGLNEVVYLYGNQNAFVISYSPSEHGYEGVLTLRVDPSAVKLYFAKEDGAKAGRYVILKSAEDLDGGEIKQQIASAVKRANISPDPSAKGSIVIRAESQKKRAERAKAAPS